MLLLPLFALFFCLDLRRRRLRRKGHLAQKERERSILGFVQFVPPFHGGKSVKTGGISKDVIGRTDGRTWQVAPPADTMRGGCSLIGGEGRGGETKISLFPPDLSLSVTLSTYPHSSHRMLDRYAAELKNDPFLPFSMPPGQHPFMRPSPGRGEDDERG